MSKNARAAVFLDRDGTIIEDRGHLHNPSQIIFFPDTFKALRLLNEHFLLFIVTNQPGIAENQITHSDADIVNNFVVTALAEKGIKITDVYTCPHKRSEDCSCIKSKPYFLKKAAARYSLDLKKSFIVGDHPHDIQLAINVGAKGLYILTGHGSKHLPEVPENTEVFDNIMQACERILSCRPGEESPYSENK